MGFLAHPAYALAPRGPQKESAGLGRPSERGSERASLQRQAATLVLPLGKLPLVSGAGVGKLGSTLKGFHHTFLKLEHKV